MVLNNSMGNSIYSKNIRNKKIDNFLFNWLGMSVSNWFCLTNHKIIGVLYLFFGLWAAFLAAFMSVRPIVVLLLCALGFVIVTVGTFTVMYGRSISFIVVYKHLLRILFLFILVLCLWGFFSVCYNHNTLIIINILSSWNILQCFFNLLYYYVGHSLYANIFVEGHLAYLLLQLVLSIGPLLVMIAILYNLCYCFFNFFRNRNFSKREVYLLLYFMFCLVVMYVYMSYGFVSYTLYDKANLFNCVGAAMGDLDCWVLSDSMDNVPPQQVNISNVNVLPLQSSISVTNVNGVPLQSNGSGVISGQRTSNLSERVVSNPSSLFSTDYMDTCIIPLIDDAYYYCRGVNFTISKTSYSLNKIRLWPIEHIKDMHRVEDTCSEVIKRYDEDHKALTKLDVSIYWYLNMYRIASMHCPSNTGHWQALFCEAKALQSELLNSCCEKNMLIYKLRFANYCTSCNFPIWWTASEQSQGIESMRYEARSVDDTCKHLLEMKYRTRVHRKLLLEHLNHFQDFDGPLRLDNQVFYTEKEFFTYIDRLNVALHNLEKNIAKWSDRSAFMHSNVNHVKCSWLYFQFRETGFHHIPCDESSNNRGLLVPDNSNSTSNSNSNCFSFNSNNEGYASHADSLYSEYLKEKCEGGEKCPCYCCSRSKIIYSDMGLDKHLATEGKSMLNTKLSDIESCNSWSATSDRRKIYVRMAPIRAPVFNLLSASHCLACKHFRAHDINYEKHIPFNIDNIDDVLVS